MRRRDSGFSLLEVLVAFAILALTMGVLMNIFSGGLRNLGQGENYTVAMLDAQSKLAELGVSIPLQIGKQGGRIDSTYRWEATITPLRTAPDLAVALYGIHVDVSWGGGTAERRVSLDTLRIAPASP
ncbi:hypothetical protein GALL_433890 [mine drainage metagenome]|uniref:General secretion pathway protein I n=1 Tax=mine drainage metagenome TaxID=410659 RepID=A0A1J5Q4W4_9ZZZZ